MSLTAPDNNKPINPCSKFIKFKGDTGVFQYWDKETKKNIELDLKNKAFIVLDTLATIKGFHEPSKSGIWSNEVKQSSRDTLTVRNKEGVLAEGLYKDIKDKIKAQGGKYTSSVYVYLVESKEMINLQLSGSALSAWINKEIDERATAITMTGTEEKKKGKVTYLSPIFAPVAWKKEEYEEALKQDQKLQEYLKEYKNYTLNAPTQEEEEEEKTVYASPEEYVQAKAEQTQIVKPNAPPF